MKKIDKKIILFMFVINMFFLICTNSYSESNLNFDLNANLNNNSIVNSSLSSDTLNISADACSLLDVDSGKFYMKKMELKRCTLQALQNL